MSPTVVGVDEVVGVDDGDAGDGLVLDFAKHMNRILEIDPESRTARVEPGVVLDQLQAAVKPHGLAFGPDPSTHSRCTLGGMIGNNSCGTHSVAWGKTVDNVRSLDVLLSDGTRVWLNGESELRFPSEFSDARREVWLRGEAFFEVTKDPQHPFVVTSDYYSATVLGTSFDARAYSPADASVTLVEGSVRVSPAGSTSALVVTPGRMVTFGAAGMMNMSEVDVYPCLQRKEGYFYFEQASMLDIMIELGRWYNKTVVFEDTAAMNTMLHFVASRSDSLATVLGHIAELDNVEIEYTDEDITISRAE